MSSVRDVWAPSAVVTSTLKRTVPGWVSMSARCSARHVPSFSVPSTRASGTVPTAAHWPFRQFSTAASTPVTPLPDLALRVIVAVRSGERLSKSTDRLTSVASAWAVPGPRSAVVTATTAMSAVTSLDLRKGRTFHWLLAQWGRTLGDLGWPSANHVRVTVHTAGGVPPMEVSQAAAWV